MVQLNRIADASAAHRFKVEESVYHPVPAFASTNFTLKEWIDKFNTNVRANKC